MSGMQWCSMLPTPVHVSLWYLYVGLTLNVPPIALSKSLGLRTPHLPASTLALTMEFPQWSFITRPSPVPSPRSPVSPQIQIIIACSQMTLGYGPVTLVPKLPDPVPTCHSNARGQQAGAMSLVSSTNRPGVKRVSCFCCCCYFVYFLWEFQTGWFSGCVKFCLPIFPNTGMNVSLVYCPTQNNTLNLTRCFSFQWSQKHSMICFSWNGLSLCYNNKIW